MSTKADIEKIERGFWDHAQDGQYYQENTAESFTGVFSGMDYVDQTTTVKMTAEASAWSDVHMSDIHFVELGQDAAALVYKAKAKQGDEKKPYAATITSVYSREDGRWKLALHEHLPA